MGNDGRGKFLRCFRFQMKKTQIAKNNNNQTLNCKDRKVALPPKNIVIQTQLRSMLNARLLR